MQALDEEEVMNEVDDTTFSSASGSLRTRSAANQIEIPNNVGKLSRPNSAKSKLSHISDKSDIKYRNKIQMSDSGTFASHIQHLLCGTCIERPILSPSFELAKAKKSRNSCFLVAAIFPHIYQRVAHKMASILALVTNFAHNSRQGSRTQLHSGKFFCRWQMDPHITNFNVFQILNRLL